MAIKIDLSNTYKEGDKIFGNIYFENDDVIFPEKNWNDFVVVIVNWWSESLYRLINNETVSEELEFMDGPLSIKINFFNENKFDLFFVNNGKVQFNTNVKMDEFVGLFIKELNSLIRFINDNNWENNDVTLLKSNYKKLSDEFRSMSLNRNNGSN